MQSLKSLLVGVCLVCAGCSGGARWSSLGGQPAAEAGVYEAVFRYIQAYYVPPSWNPSPAGWCLATGRRASEALRDRVRESDEPWMPLPRLLAALSDVRPAVHPVSDCVADPDGTERLRDGGNRAVLLVLSNPDWESPEAARVTAWTRQDQRARNRFSCRVARRVDGWIVRECL